MGLKRVVRICMNSTQTGGEEDPFNSQPPKLAVGAPTDTSWAPRAHGGRDPVSTGYPGRLPFTPWARGSGPRAHEVPKDSLMRETEICVTFSYELRFR